MIRIKDPASSPTKETRKITFDTVTLSQLHGLLTILNKDEAYLFDSIRQYFEIPQNYNVILVIKLTNCVQNLDVSWERRVKSMYRNMLELEKLMWNLSTLGGAYSAMGDFDTKFAETAAKITQHQIAIAKRFGNPALLARCFLYTALAEAQMGRFSQSVKIVRAVNYWSKLNDCELVLRCSQGVYQKIVAIHKFGIASKAT